MNEVIIAIDPGPTQSAIVFLTGDVVTAHHTLPNISVAEMLAVHAGNARVVIEMIASYGMSVGQTTFETCVAIGRFIEVVFGRTGCEPHRLTRIKVKTALCHSAKAKDANVRQALIDRFGGPTAIRKGGLLYKVKGDEWAALAVAVAFQEQEGNRAVVAHNARTIR